MTGIERATAADIAEAAYVIGQAFHPLPVCQWLVPPVTERSQVLSANMAIYVEHALTYGDVHLARAATGIVGVAVWIDRTRPVPEPPRYETRLAAACGPWTDNFAHLDQLFEQHHPTRAHHHLAMLAVRPDQQHCGIGNALLAHHHTHLDRYAIAGYLEASSEPSRDLYVRHRYHLLADPFTTPNGARFWPMWRPATHRPAAST